MPGNDIEPVGPNTKLTADQLDTALATLAMMGPRKASRALKDQGIDVTAKSLCDYRDRFYPRRYAHIVSEMAPQLEEAVIAKTRDAITHAADLEIDLIQKVAESFHNLEPRDQAAALRNISTAKAINVDKYLTLTGRPNTITEHRSADEILRKLTQAGVIEGTTEEDEDPPQLQPANP